MALQKSLASLGFIAFSIAISAAADACSRRVQITDAQLFSEAENVFVGRVVSTRLKNLPRRQCEADGISLDECSIVEAKYELFDTLKGAPKRNGKVRDLVFGPGNCSLGLLAGYYYVFYADKEFSSVLHINGSFPLGQFYGERERRDVERVRNPPHSRPIDGE